MSEENRALYVLKHHEIVPFILKRESEGMKLNERGKISIEDYNNNGKLWSGTKTIEEAFEKSIKGCKSCTDLVKGPIVHILRKQNQWGIDYALPNDVSGPIVDPGALSLGIPECCVLPEVHKKHTLGDEGIDIICNTVVSCVVGTEVIRARGIVASTLAIIAERMEIATRIIVGYTNDDTGSYYKGGNRNDFAIILKDYSQPLDIPLMAFYLVSPASSRRIGFSLFDSVDKDSSGRSHRLAANTAYKSPRKTTIVIDHGHIRESMLEPEMAVEEALNILRRNGVIV